MDINKLSKNYKVRELTENDIDSMLELGKNNDIFFQYNPPVFTRESILEDMKALPPGKERNDKCYLGFFQEDTLIAHMDLIRDFPEEGTNYIGLFMVHADYQGKGVGTEIITQTLAYFKEAGYNRVRLAIDRGNPQSKRFWTKQGFLKVNEGTEKHIPMEKVLL